MKIGEYRKETAKPFFDLFGEEGAALRDILLCAFLETDKSALLLKSEEPLPAETAARMEDAVKELMLDVPVQYIVGHAWFYGLKIKVGKGCFIPRNDTETLADAAIKCLPRGGAFAELCAGSGAVSAAVAFHRPDAAGFSLELSFPALRFAKENLKVFPNVRVRRFDVLDEDDYRALIAEEKTKFDLLVCNPPYIRSDTIEMLGQRLQYEPRGALDGGEDGLLYYREITRLAPLILKESGVILYEVGYDQAEDTAFLLRRGGYQTAAIKDLSGIERVILGKKY